MSDARDNYITISKHEWDHYGDLKTRNAELAAEREALKAERDATKHELSMVRDVARADNLRADMADQYERWLLDLGRISGCGHLDDRLPQCIEEAFESLRTQLAAAKAEGEEWKAESERRGRELQVQVINCRELHEIIEKQKTELATARLHVSTLSEACVASDSFGVEGSSFNHCMVCNGGGSPYVKFEHDAKCPVLLAEGKVAEWLEEIRADELASMERSEKLEKELAAAQKTIAANRRVIGEATPAFAELLKSHAFWTKDRCNAYGESYTPTDEERDAAKAIATLTAALAATDGGGA